jgi:hypothetical protein
MEEGEGGGEEGVVRDTKTIEPTACIGNMNVFGNTYSAPENRLTYNFLCTVDLIADGQCGLLHFLLAGKGIQLSTSPIIEIRPLFAFEGGSNPDGARFLALRKLLGSSVS